MEDERRVVRKFSNLGARETERRIRTVDRQTARPEAQEQVAKMEYAKSCVMLHSLVAPQK